MEITAGIIGVVLALFIYFLPTIIAIARKHINVLAIFVLNLLTGWTFIGWIISIVWSFKV